MLCLSRSQKKLVTLEARHHTKGSVLFAWQPQGSVLATCGQNRVLNIFNRQGEAQVEIPLTSGNGCAATLLMPGCDASPLSARAD